MMDIIYTSNSQRLTNIVRLLSHNRGSMDEYYENYVFKPYNIDIRRSLPDSKIEDAKRLLDLSFTTRQGGQNKASLKEYEKATQNIYEALRLIMEVLAKPGKAKDKYYYGLFLTNSLINGIGQKISTMFLKFLIYYSDDFPEKDQLLRELFIPFDVHVLRLLFSKEKVEKNKVDEHNRLNLYPEVDKSQLKYDFDMNDIKKNKRILPKRTKLFEYQTQIRNDFDILKIEEPPIILDYLWYVGKFYCSARLKDIGCKICFLQEECETAKLTC